MQKNKNAYKTIGEAAKAIGLVNKKNNLDEEFSLEAHQAIIDYHKKLIKQLKRLNKFFIKFAKC